MTVGAVAILTKPQRCGSQISAASSWMATQQPPERQPQRGSGGKGGGRDVDDDEHGQS